MRILIVEDEPGSRLLRKPLEELGHDCVHTESNSEAWDLFETIKPDLVISDFSKPSIDGLDLLRRVRETVTDQHVVFLMAVNDDQPDSVRSSMAAGADDYLAKPVSSRDLEGRMLVAERTLVLHRRIKDKRYELDRLNQELFEENRRDPLTRIGNRLRLEEDLDALAGRAKRYGHAFSVLLCDIDEFKKYNEACGHTAGDETLRSIARTIASYGRSGDMAYRYAGEEFMVVVPEQSLERATIAAERRRTAVEKLGIPNPVPEGGGSVTISIGVAAFDPDDELPLQGMLRRAEEALRKAKLAGRNRVYIHDSDRARSSRRDSQTPSSPP